VGHQRGPLLRWAFVLLGGGIRAHREGRSFPRPTHRAYLQIRKPRRGHKNV
jgi:hypothetical protein